MVQYSDGVPVNLIWAQTDEFTGLAIRIFRTRKAAFEAADKPVCIEKALAVSQVRRQVFNRQEGVCLRCPNIILWTTGHLHENISRGQGGEVSLENCEMLCADCHLNGAHGDRRPQFTNRTDREPITR